MNATPPPRLSAIIALSPRGPNYLMETAEGEKGLFAQFQSIRWEGVTEEPLHHGHPIGGETVACSRDQERGRPELRRLSSLPSYSVQALGTGHEDARIHSGSRPLAWSSMGDFHRRAHRCASTLLILNLADSEDRLS